MLRMTRPQTLLLLTSALWAALAASSAYVATAFTFRLVSTATTRMRLAASSSASSSSFDRRDVPTPCRRQMLQQTATASSIILLQSLLLGSNTPPPAWALDDYSIGASVDKPVVVIGAGGKVGKLCCELLAQQQKYVVGVTRTGRAVLDSENKYVQYAAADVKDYDALASVTKDASGVIFAASASGKKKGGEPIDVDYKGVYYTGKACLINNVKKLVIVSAATATRPDSLGFKATNFAVKFVYGPNIMDAKIAGEEAVRDLYASKPSLGYTVVRPGGLTDGAAMGSTALHVSQGDVYAGEVSRADVAAVAVAALLQGKATDNVTLELSKVEGIGKAQGDLPDVPPALVHAGAPNMEQLLSNLVTDADMKAQYGNILNDFKGADMPSAKSFE